MYLYIEQITFSLRKIIICLLIIFLSGCNSSPDNDQPTGNEVSANPDLLNDTLRLLCTEDQLHLASHLTNEFQKYHPTAATEISLCEPGNPEEILTQKKNDLFLVSDANFSNVNEDYWHIKYARDGVVGIINESNIDWSKRDFVRPYIIHAEMNAIREACKKLKTNDLLQCEIYATFKPCPMCYEAIKKSGIKTIYYGAGPEDVNYTLNEKKVSITSGVMLKECMELTSKKYKKKDK